MVYGLGIEIGNFAIRLLLQRTENTVEEIRGLLLKFMPKPGEAVHECAAALVA
jgi:hypothetical protein